MLGDSNSYFDGNKDFEMLRKMRNRIQKDLSKFGKLGELWETLEHAGTSGSRPWGTAGGRMTERRFYTLSKYPFNSDKAALARE